VVQVRPTDADCCFCPSRFRTALWLQLRSPMGQDDSPTGARMRSNRQRFGRLKMPFAPATGDG